MRNIRRTKKITQSRRVFSEFHIIVYSKRNRQTSAKAPLCRAEKLIWNRRVGAVLAFKV